MNQIKLKGICMKKPVYLSKAEFILILVIILFYLVISICFIIDGVSLLWIIIHSIIFGVLLISSLDTLANYVPKLKVKVYYVTLNVTFDNELGESFNKFDNHYVYTVNEYYKLEELDALYKHINNEISSEGFILKNVYAESINYIGTTYNNKL